MKAKKRAHCKLFVKLITITLYTILVIIAIVMHGIGLNTILEIITYTLLGFGLYMFVDNIANDLKEILE